MKRHFSKWPINITKFIYINIFYHREMHIKTALRFHLISSRMSITNAAKMLSKEALIYF